MALFANADPPHLDMVHPSFETWIRRRHGLEHHALVQDIGLCSTHKEKLLVLSLKESHPERQIQGHDPVFDIARENAIERIDHEDHEDIDMKDHDGRKDQTDLPHLDNGVFTQAPKPGTQNEEDKGIRCSKPDERISIAVTVLTAPVMAVGVGVADHDVRRWLEGRGAGQV